MSSVNTTLQEKIATLHASQTLAYVVASGAGAGCQNILSRVPGASNTLLESVFPYSKEALVGFLGEEPQSFCTEETAIKLAQAAYKRGRNLASRAGKDPKNVVGLALTGAVGTNRRLRGKHRIYVAAKTVEGVHVVYAEFKKTVDGDSLLGRDRECELADLIMVNLLLHVAGIEQCSFDGYGVMSDDIDRSGRSEASLTPRLLHSAEGSVPEEYVQMPDGQIVDPSTLELDQYVFFPGSFNPLHDGHRQIAAEVVAKTKKTVAFFISADHPDKGRLDDEDLKNRAKQFSWYAPVVVTSGNSLYLDKAQAFPGAGFILGVDVLLRMLDPKYYTCTVEEMLRTFRSLGTTFFVAPRDLGNGVVSPSKILEGIDAEFRDMFVELENSSLVSSTELRAGRV